MADPVAGTSLITSLVAFVATLATCTVAILTKESKTSEFRQAWIDGLRSDLSEFLAHAHAIARLVSTKRRYAVKDGDIEQFLYEFQDEIIAQKTCRQRIVLRLNRIEHRRLIDLVINLDNIKPLHTDEGVQSNIAEHVVAEAGIVLKKEWNTVKKGEWVFRVVKVLLIVLVVTTFLLLFPAVRAIFASVTGL